MTDDLKRFNIRLQDSLRKVLEKEADISGRSLQAEIVVRLQWSLDQSVPFQEVTASSIAPTYGVRLPRELHQELLDHAKSARPKRSLNTEVLARLVYSLTNFERAAVEGHSPADKPHGLPDDILEHEVFDLVAKLSPKKKDALALILKDSA